MIVLLLTIVISCIVYFIYFLTYSTDLSELEIIELSKSQRFWDIEQSLNFSNYLFTIDKNFKANMSKSGQFYKCSQKLIDFPSFAAALLKRKKHEWIIYGFGKDNTVFTFYTNKGIDNTSVSPNITVETMIEFAQTNSAQIILEFHNHPNAVLSPSAQDLISTKNTGAKFIANNLSFLSFVCGRGEFSQYGWWFHNNFHPLKKYITNNNKKNKQSRSENFRLRKELRKKRSYRELILQKDSSSNI